jgi:hypothetical protein
VKFAAVLLTGILLAGCQRGGIENKEAVRQGVIDYLAGRDLNVASMNIEVTSVTFKGDEADAAVSFTPRGAAGGGQGMSMRYLLERQGNRWVVKSRSDSGADPHGTMPPPSAPAGEMPPGHPPVPGSGQK